MVLLAWHPLQMTLAIKMLVIIPFTRLPSPKKAILVVGFALMVSLHPLQKYLIVPLPALSVSGLTCWLASGEGLVALDGSFYVLTDLPVPGNCNNPASPNQTSYTSVGR